MSTRKTSLPVKKNVLAVSAKLLLANGYKNTTIREIAREAGVSVSSVQNFFHSKESILLEFTRIMFDEQFGAAKQLAKDTTNSVTTYAIETAIQLVMTEKSEQLREIYTAAYTLPETVEYIYQQTAKELMLIFGDRFPDYGESDFYEMEIGSAGLMRNYMAKQCNMHFSLKKKIERFLTSSLRVYRISEDEIAQILELIRNMDINRLADEVMQRLFTVVNMNLDVSYTQADSRE